MKKTDNEIKFIKSAKRKFAEFISKNSVYGIFAVVLIAVCAITILALPHSKQNPSDIIDANPTFDATNKPTEKPTPTIPNKNTATPPSNPSTTDIVGEITPTPPSVDSPTPDHSTDVNADPTSKFTITLPFNKNTIITSYSNETPIYSETLHEWACHVGLDFSCKEGDDVNAAANGIVVNVTTDDLYGVSVLISHEDGFFTLYKGLKSANVNNDELVAEGQSIGSAAESVPFEAHMPSHIHFELIKDNLSVNPISFAR